MNRKKVLIVDDELDAREMMRRKLERGGFDVRAAADGLHALELIAREAPDVIVLDVVMPRMDGFAFYKEIKQYEGLRHIPVIVLTARAGMKDTFLAMGTDEFLTKPFEAQDLLEKIEKVLGVKAKLSEEEKASAGPMMIAAGNPETGRRMAEDLKEQAEDAVWVRDGKELLREAVRANPGVLVIDVALEDIPSDEIIRALRSISILKDLFILTYSLHVLSPQTPGKDASSSGTDRKIRLCRLAGADDYLGEVTEADFAQLLLDYLNAPKKEE